MKTLNLTLVILGLLMINELQAQMGIQAGATALNGDSFLTDDGEDLVGSSVGYTVGLTYNKRIAPFLVLQPSLNLLNKRWRDELDDVNGDITVTLMSINYIEIPVQLMYKQNKVTGFFAGGGPSLIYGISGKRKITFNGDSSSTDYEFGDAEGQENPLTIAINMMAGYSFRTIQIGLNYTHGLTNQSGDEQTQGNAQHVALRIGYVFGVR
ncbi:MAG: PorT family protein [Cyclobacteriaceae bacterium]|nr:PorT family protein [Cyclobacteriaceae bacterium]UYN87806.1 MAG: PorT family protein [Cyclobacteriaceae bacterium]